MSENEEKKSLVEFHDTEEEAEKIAARQLIEEYYDKENGRKATPLVMVEDPKDKGKTNKFLVILSMFDETKDWKICFGRDEAYGYIKDFIEVIDITESYIISEKDIIEDKISVYTFLKHVIESGKIEDPGFDPDDYLQGDYDHEEEEE